MESAPRPLESEWPFPVPTERFDQKNEMFKRSIWDEKMQPHARRFYEEVLYQERAGYRKLDYALRNAAWNLEWGFGFGNSRSNHGLYAWEGVPAKIRRFVETDGRVVESPEQMSRLVKKTARFFGADLVGVCRVHPNWIYSHEYNLLTGEHYPIDLPGDVQHAIVMAIAMDYEATRCAPSGVAGAATGLGYSKMASLANLMASFIRGLGYRAVPCGNDTALSIPLAMAAGLGEGSRMGLLITDEYGPRVRLCKVFTDLPLRQDPYRSFGAAEFCRTCRKCAIHCPSQAIPDREMTSHGPNVSNQSGIFKWYVDAEKCFAFWAKNRMDCSTCIRVCPFNKPRGLLHDAVRTVIRMTPVFNPLLTRIDDLLRYDRMHPAKEFWDSN